MLVICRALQGLFSGPMVPLSQTILLRTFPPDKRTIALALWAMTVLLAPIFGPVVGGWIVDTFSWPWIFLINLPIGLFSFAVCTAMLRPDAQRGTAGPIDVPGIVLLVIGVGSLQAMLDLGHDRGWFGSPLIVTLAVVAALSIVSLLIWEAGEAHPVVDLSLFRDRTFSFCVLIISLGMMSFSVVGVVFPLWMQAVMATTRFTRGRHGVARRARAGVLDPRRAACASLRRARARDLRLPRVRGRARVGCAFHAEDDVRADRRAGADPGDRAAVLLHSADRRDAVAHSDDRLAAASSLSNFLRTLSAAFGTAMSVTLWDNRATYHYDVVSQSVTHASANTQRFVHTLNAMGVDGVRELSTLHQVVMQQAYMMATNDMFWMASMTCLALAAMMWLTRPKRAAAAFGH